MRVFFAILCLALLGCKEGQDGPGTIHQFSECYTQLNTGVISKHAAKQQCAKETEGPLPAMDSGGRVSVVDNSLTIDVAFNFNARAGYVITRVAASLSYYDGDGVEFVFSGQATPWLEPSDFESVRVYLQPHDGLRCRFDSADEKSCKLAGKVLASKMPSVSTCGDGDKNVNCRTWSLLALKGIRMEK